MQSRFRIGTEHGAAPWRPTILEQVSRWESGKVGRGARSLEASHFLTFPLTHVLGYADVAQQRQQQFRKLPGVCPTRVRVSPSAPALRYEL